MFATLGSGDVSPRASSAARTHPRGLPGIPSPVVRGDRLQTGGERRLGCHCSQPAARREVPRASTDGSGALPRVPQSKGVSAFGIHSSFEDESWLYPRLPHGDLLPGAFATRCHLNTPRFWQITPSKAFPAPSVILDRTGDISDR